MDFPSKKGNEMVVPNEDGSYTILINAGLNYESQLKAYEHAMSHITNDDFLKGNVQEIEYYAHHPHKDPEPAQIYLDRIKQLQAERRRLKKLIARDQKRVEFIHISVNLFASSNK